MYKFSTKYKFRVHFRQFVSKKTQSKKQKQKGGGKRIQSNYFGLSSNINDINNITG